MKAIAEVAKAQGVNKVAQEAGVNRESLYKSLKGGAKTRFETVKKLLMAVGVELTVQPIAANSMVSNIAKPTAVAKKPAVAKPTKAVAKPTATKLAAATKPAVPKQAASGKTRNGRAVAAARGKKGQIEIEDSLAAG